MAKTLPRFAIQSIEGGTAVGKADASRWIGVGHLVALVLGERFIWGKWRGGESSGGSAAIQLDDPTHADALRVGEAYSFIDSYWGDRAELVLDSSTTWRKSVFAPVDALSVSHPDSTLITKASPDGPSGQILAGGWDHEHCEICYQKIGIGSQAAGWLNSQSQWVCEACYSAYLATRSIEFVNVE
jgi:hypothetical protein